MDKILKKHILALMTALLSVLDAHASTWNPVTNILTVDSIVVAGNTYANVTVALTPQQAAAATFTQCPATTGTACPITTTTNTYDPVTGNLTLYYVQNLQPPNVSYANVNVNILGDSIIPGCKTSANSAQIIPNDPLFVNQWHLLNSGQKSATSGIPSATAGQDLNITGAWSQATGCGIRIAIVDDGLDYYHEDLNVDIANSIDFAKSTPNDTNGTGIKGPSQGSHGTAVAGLAAAKGNNGTGVTGAAYNATLVGYNYLATSNKANELSAMLSGLTGIPFNHIYSNSWGSNATGMIFATNTAWSSAISTGNNYGRNGLGAIYTFAAGNDTYNFRTNYDPYTNNQGVFTIAGMNAQGIRAVYSCVGSNVLVSAFSGVRCDNSLTSTTTDIMSINPAWGFNSGGKYASFDYTAGDYNTPAYPNANLNYTRCMTGTSAATPEASGVIALMLEANSALSWRDVRWILATTARQNDPPSGGSGSYDSQQWFQNGAGYGYNDSYGFGAIDATRAVQTAKNWTASSLLPAQKTYPGTTFQSSATSTPNKAIADGTALVTNDPVTKVDFRSLLQPETAYYGAVTSDTITVTNSGIKKIEFVELTVTSNHPEFGDLKITLTSPSSSNPSTAALRHACENTNFDTNTGTSTTVFNGSCGPGLLNGYTFGIVRHLGEPADGVWTLNMADGNGNAKVGNLQSWSLKIYGY
jgi:proprotein convertase subtilisin/kexin type 2